MEQVHVMMVLPEEAPRRSTLERVAEGPERQDGSLERRRGDEHVEVGRRSRVRHVIEARRQR